MGKRKYITGVLIAIAFLCSLYFVEAGVCGSGIVAKYNEGYGTFDMKSYDAATVKTILSTMTKEGIDVYKNYYVYDYVFIFFFGLFQCYISIVLFQEKRKWSVSIICLIPIIRGVCDIIENSILLHTLVRYPGTDFSMIGVAKVFTIIKLLMIRLWVIELAIGVTYHIILRRRRKKCNDYKGNYYL